MGHKGNSDKIVERAAQITFLVMDCDGVLTDGRLYFSENGEEMKAFDVRDGQGLVWWHKAGGRSAIISGRDSPGIINARAKDLGIHHVRANSPDKVRDFQEIISEEGIAPENAAFVGDDIGDVDLMKLVGLPIAVKDAIDEVKEAAAFVTRAKGGRGAVREICDILLKARKND
jgi:3-deoxy-D-manno-octulosonate 8-phosphate phosphatase (KDO 8-P phosphatase)